MVARRERGAGTCPRGLCRGEQAVLTVAAPMALPSPREASLSSAPRLSHPQARGTPGPGDLGRWRAAGTRASAQGSEPRANLRMGRTVLSLSPKGTGRSAGWTMARAWPESLLISRTGVLTHVPSRGPQDGWAGGWALHGCGKVTGCQGPHQWPGPRSWLGAAVAEARVRPSPATTGTCLVSERLAGASGGLWVSLLPRG